MDKHLGRDLRHYQAELEIQNKALRFSQAAAENAYERFVTLFSNVPLALIVVLEDGQILQHNAQALALLQPRETDPPPSFLFPLFNASDLKRVKQSFALAHQRGAATLTELTMRCGVDGSVAGDLHIARIDDALDGAAQFICAIIDQGPQIAQRQALQQSADTLRQRNLELTLSRGRLAAIIDSSLDAIVGVDTAQRITVFNPAATRLFGCSAKQAQGQVVTRFIPALKLTLTELGEGVSMQLGELNGRRQDGQTVTLDVSLSREPHANGDNITLFIHDLTSRKKMQAHRDALEVQLRESQKMQAIGTMAGGIAHDFNNIIGAILGNVELARDDATSNPAVITSLAEIDKAGRRARDLVRQILAFSRNDPPNRRLLCLAEVVQESTRLLKVTLPPQVHIALDIAPNTPAVMADATQIEQVLLNLCTNAIHAIGAKPGTIRIELGYALRNAADNVERRSGLRGQHVWLRVADTGCGIAPEIQLRVFEPFFTTKPVGQGTGLGLSVVHGIMRAHHGSVQLQSTTGAGSTFTLLFPVPDTQTQATGVAVASAAAALAPVVAGSGQRVMYVDDDEALVFLVKRLLTRKGYTVATFTDPQQALLALTEPGTRCDLLVTDFNMPGYSGINLMRDVIHVRPGLWVALASGYVTPEIERQALAAGARAFIHKPNDVEELCATVQRLLQESQLSS
ncbi:MAG: hybrid sensor histidine kinase/response regulator [Comamonadaceae bacterium CG1_02_60_18]|nr:MAG: hybrid sensor histidine kinase/response regulator [Comamonadaceae bacterium CG1_02_60_18]